ncbi:MAG TPA: YdcF family protein [Rhizobacter sp.]|nr:YdcF family protein [Rhizobacter sp.]
MNGLVTLLGIDAWKPILSALVLPPVPLLLLILIGARLILPRRGLGWFVIMLGIAGLWLSTCFGTARWLNEFVLKQPPALTTEAIDDLKAAVKAKQTVAIVVLGGGLETLAPEYGVTNLAAVSLERLRYGLWLSRATGAPVAVSGGIGWGQTEGQPEAQTAARIASVDFGHPIKWIEDQSRDTHENAARTIALLKPAGITHIVLVTHGWHMPRARKDFERAAGPGIAIQAAPMGLASKTNTPVLDWMPSISGFAGVNRALHELLGLLLGT